MAVAIQVFIVLLVLFNFFVLFMCAKRWRIVHVLCTFLVFAVAIWFVFLTAFSLKTRTSWEKKFQQLTADLEKADVDAITLKLGDADKGVETVDFGHGPVLARIPEKTLLGVKVALEQEQFDRGRIWGNCQPDRFNGTSLVVHTFVPDPAAPADAPIKMNKMVEKMTLFAFKERDEDGLRVPYQYLGEFVATAVTDTSVTITPSLPLDPVQITAINTADATWALYEVMPVDSHEAFKGMMTPTGYVAFTRDTLSKFILRTDEKKVLDEYEYDLMPVLTIEKLEKERKEKEPAASQDQFATFDPPADRIWWKVEFIKPHTIDPDSPDAPVVDKNMFDTSGRALPKNLRQNEPTSFSIGDTAIFDDLPHEDASPSTVSQLVDDGICKRLEKIYVRPLHNYEQSFHEIEKRVNQVADQSAIVLADTANIKAGLVNAELQKDAYTKELDGVAKDLKQMDATGRVLIGGVEYEAAEIKKYRIELESRLAKRRAELSELYRTNNVLAAELTALQKKIAEDLEKQPPPEATESTSILQAD